METNDNGSINTGESEDDKKKLCDGDSNSDTDDDLCDDDDKWRNKYFIFCDNPTNLSSSNICTYPEELTANYLRERIVFKCPFTNTHRQINAAMDTVNDFDLFNWDRHLHSTINNITQQKPGKMDTKHINQII